MDLGEEIGDIEALGDEGEQALQGLGLFGVELGVEEGGDVDVVGVVVEVRVRSDPEHQRWGLAQALRRRSELWEHAAGVGGDGGDRGTGNRPPSPCAMGRDVNDTFPRYFLIRYYFLANMFDLVMYYVMGRAKFI